MNFIEIVRKYEAGDASLDAVIDCKRSIMRTQAQYRLVMGAVDEWLQDGKHHDLLSAELVLLEACRVRRGGTAWAS